MPYPPHDAYRVLDEASMQVFWRTWPGISSWAGSLWRLLNEELMDPAVPSHHPDARGVLALTVAATAGALLSMATKDRAATLGLPPAPEGALGWLLGGRDGRLLLVAMGALLGAPLAALAAVTATSALSLGLRVAFLRRPPAT
jgi:hypothetical protein